MGVFRGFVVWFHCNKFLVVGVFFILLQLSLFFKYLFLSRPENLVWFCSHSSLLFGFAFLYRKIHVIKALISVGLVIQLLWVVDYLGKLFFGVFVFGASDYMFMDIPRFSYVVSAVEHFFTGTLALGLTFKFKTERKVLYWAFGYLLLLLVVSVVVNTGQDNFNLTEHMIIFGEFTFPGYYFAWPFLAMLVIVLPTYYFQGFLYYLYKKYSRK